MKCPHCLVAFHAQITEHPIDDDVEGRWTLLRCACPTCKKLVLSLRLRKVTPIGGNLVTIGSPTDVLVRPKGIARAPCPVEVPDPYMSDYKEACLVLPDSPKAAAALARRCLQNVLRGAAQVTHGNLAEEIQQVIDSGRLPSQLAESIDAIRNIGNFAAHPIKSQQTGQIVDVEPGEAEWNIDVLELLFDFYFVQPAVTRKKRAALDQKLQSAGKPPMK
jgi:Domain of unknown function (DUF4145)